MKILIIQFGKKYRNLTYGLPYDILIEAAGKKLGLNKSEVKRLDKQGGIKIYVT